MCELLKWEKKLALLNVDKGCVVTNVYLKNVEVVFVVCEEHNQ